VEPNGLPFVAKCAAVLPALWLALFVLASAAGTKEMSSAPLNVMLASRQRPPRLLVSYQPTIQP